MRSLVQVRDDGEFGCFDEFRRRSLLCGMSTGLQTKREKELSNTILENLRKAIVVVCFVLIMVRCAFLSGPFGKHILIQNKYRRDLFQLLKYDSSLK